MREATHVLCLGRSNIIVVISKRIHIQRIPCFSKAFKFIRFSYISQIGLSNCSINFTHYFWVEIFFRNGVHKNDGL